MEREIRAWQNCNKMKTLMHMAIVNFVVYANLFYKTILY